MLIPWPSAGAFIDKSASGVKKTEAASLRNLEAKVEQLVVDEFGAG